MTYTYQYPRYKITCDVACLWQPIGYPKQLLIVQRGVEPGKGQWALPGGNLNPDELLSECAARELKEETGLTANELIPVGNFDGIDRAPGDRAINCLFKTEFYQEDEPIVTVGDDAVDYRWVVKDELADIDFAFDCLEMAEQVL